MRDVCLIKQEERAAERVKQIKERIEQESKKGKLSGEGGAILLELKLVLQRMTGPPGGDSLTTSFANDGLWWQSCLLCR